MPAPTQSTIIPCLRYRDAHAAIEWLCETFGFRRHQVYDDDQGGVAHAQLVHEGGMIMLGSMRDNAYSQHLVSLEQTEGRETQTTYVVVADCRAHFERARRGGARIVLDYEEKDYGGGGYTCADLEGHIWSFGSYDPWTAEP